MLGDMEHHQGFPMACGADGHMRVQLRVGLAFVHTPSASEADFLFPEAGGARRKRKHGSDAVQPGRAPLLTRQLHINNDSNIHASSILGQVVVSYVDPGLLAATDCMHCNFGPNAFRFG